MALISFNHLFLRGGRRREGQQQGGKVGKVIAFLMICVLLVVAAGVMIVLFGGKMKMEENDKTSVVRSSSSSSSSPSWLLPNAILFEQDTSNRNNNKNKGKEEEEKKSKEDEKKKKKNMKKEDDSTPPIPSTFSIKPIGEKDEEEKEKKTQEQKPLTSKDDFFEQETSYNKQLHSITLNENEKEEKDYNNDSEEEKVRKGRNLRRISTSKVNNNNNNNIHEDEDEVDDDDDDDDETYRDGSSSSPPPPHAAKSNWLKITKNEVRDGDNNVPLLSPFRNQNKVNYKDSEEETSNSLTSSLSSSTWNSNKNNNKGDANDQKPNYSKSFINVQEEESNDDHDIIVSSSSNDIIMNTNDKNYNHVMMKTNKKKKKKNSPSPPHYNYYYNDLDEFNNRLLQETGNGGGGSTSSSSSSSTPICSNISDTFQTTYVLLVQGNESLFTETQANKLAATFITSYNDQRNNDNTDTTTTTTTTCDPLFRSITKVDISANVSFTGVNQGQIIENPLPIRPVRERRQQRQRERKLRSPYYNNNVDNWNIFKSSHLEFEKIIKNLKQKEEAEEGGGGGLVDTIMGHPHQENQLHPRRQLNSTSLDQQLNSTSLDRRPYRSSILLMLLDISGTCRGCQGQTQAFDLFDDISSSSSPFVRHKKRRQKEEEKEEEQQEERYLQDDQQEINENDCICPDDSVVADATDFENSFTSKVEDLRDSGEIEFVEQVEEVIPVLETKCPTKDQDFSTVFLVKDVVFSRSILFSLGVEGVQEVEFLLRDTYNGISQQLCDPIYRAITKNQLVSIEQEEQGSTKVRMEFVVEATCRGDNCIDVGCIFDDASSCGAEQRDRYLKNNIYDSNSSMLVPEEKVTDNSLIGSSRMLKDDDDEERCFCRKGRSKRPPNPQEFQEAFQKGLNDITKNNKLSSCQECSFSFACQSGVCLAGRCAEADTQLLLNSCTCNTNEECESGFCQDTSSTAENNVGGNVLLSGTCQGKLTSCRVCNNDEECLSGVCTGGRCADAIDGKLKTGCECSSNLSCRTGRCVDNFINTGVPGKCTEKISNTCNEPCLSSTDCLSGLCGSVVCMPVNGTLLPDGCLSTLRTECESAMLENNICIPASEAPSFEPSVKPTPGPTFQPSPAPSKIPSSSPSTGPSHGPTTGPSKEPSTPPTSGPSTAPSWTPSTPPTTGPSQSPSTLPTTQPSQSPSISPSKSPSAAPTMLPSTSPSITPTTGFPSLSPSSSPTTSPSTSPSATPSTSFPSTYPSVTPTNPLIRYGDKIFLQNSALANRWLMGCGIASDYGPTDTMAGVFTFDVFLDGTNSYVLGGTNPPDYYTWTVRSETGDGDVDFVDPKQPECVKYGDIVILQCNCADNRWLLGAQNGRETVLEYDNALTYDLLDTGQVFQLPGLNHRWTISSEFGRDLTEEDPIQGDCVDDLSSIFLVLDTTDFFAPRWLTGARGTRYVASRDVSSQYEQDASLYYTWIIRSTPGDGTV